VFCIVDNHIKKLKSNVFFKFIKFNCVREKILNSKIISFFFTVILLSVEDFKPFSTKLCLKQFYSKYEVAFIFLKFSHFILKETNKSFKMNSEKFFVNTNSLGEFLIYYKYYLLIIFEKRSKFFF